MTKEDYDDKMIEVRLAELRGYHSAHMEIGKRLFKPGGGLHPLDFLAFGTLNRSLQLTSAFCDLIEKRQSLAATPLVRLQLDSALRFSAIRLVKNPQQLAMEAIKGKPIREMLDQSGRQMTDNHLVNQLAKVHPWVRPVYDNTSGFIHLSEKHVLSAMVPDDDPNAPPGRFHGYISANDQFIPNTFRLELLDAFTAATDLFFEQVNWWADIKDQLSVGEKPKDSKPGRKQKN